MPENSFTDNDKEEVVKFMNFIYHNAKWDHVSTQQAFDLFKMFNYMQTQILPKIDSHVLEIKKLHNNNSNDNSNKDS